MPSKQIRKHKGINQKTGRLNKGYKYSSKVLKSGLKEIVKVQTKKPVRKTTIRKPRKTQKGGSEESLIQRILTKKVKERGIAKKITEMREKPITMLFRELMVVAPHRNSENTWESKIARTWKIARTIHDFPRFEDQLQDDREVYEVALDGTSRFIGQKDMYHHEIKNSVEYLDTKSKTVYYNEYDPRLEHEEYESSDKRFGTPDENETVFRLLLIDESDKCKKVYTFYSHENKDKMFNHPQFKRDVHPE